MAGLRRHLDEAYGECLRHVDGVGADGPGGKAEKEKENRIEIGEGPKGRGKGKRDEGGKKGEDAVADDPVAAFLKMKRNEKYAHLMMLGTY